MTKILQKAVRESGKTYLQLERATGVKRGSILRFMRDEHSLLLSGAEKLCKYLGLVLVPKAGRGRKGRK
jgi:transcriptional regulator with XRE-family HTH domain